MSNTKCVIVIIGICAAVYANSLGNKFVYDDVHFVEKNDSIRSLKNIPSFFTSVKSFSSKGEFYIYRPLSAITYALDYFIFKLNPFGYHLSNVLWHALNGVMLYFLAGLIFRNKALALMVSALFIVHPIQTETVAWVSQRSNLISSFFFLLSLFFWIKMRGKKEDGSQDLKFLYAGSLIAFVMALFGKEMAITLPVILILYDFFFLDGMKGLKKRFKSYVPFICAGILYVLLRSIVLGRLSGQDEFVGGSVFTAVLTMLKATAFYAGLLLAPLGLCAEHGFLPAKSLFDVHVVGSAVLVLGLLVLAGRLFANSRKLSFFIFWFFVTLLPVSNIIPLQDVIVAERFLYLPSIGFYAVLAVLAMRLYNSNIRWARKATVGFSMLLILVYGFLTVNRNVDWKNGFNLCSSTIKQNPASYRALNGLGLYYLNKGMHDKAIEKFEKVIDLRPTYAIAHNNLAMAYERSGSNEKAQEIYERIKDTEYYADEIMFNAAEAFHKRGMHEEAIAKYREVLKINPQHSKTHNNLGCIYLNTGREEEAVEEYKKSVESDPDYFEGYYNLGVMAVKNKEYDKGLRLYNKVIKLKPDYARAYNSIGEVYFAKGMTDKAIITHRKAIGFDAESAGAYNNLGVIYNNSQKYDEAVKVYKKAIKIKPDFAAAYNGLGVAYWGKGMKEKAEKEIKKALEINPELPEAKSNYKLIKSIDETN